MLYRSERERVQGPDAFRSDLEPAKAADLESAWAQAWEMFDDAAKRGGKVWECPLEEPELEPGDLEILDVWALVDGQVVPGVPSQEMVADGKGKSRPGPTSTPYALSTVALDAALRIRRPGTDPHLIAQCVQAMFSTKASRRIAYRVPAELRDAAAEAWQQLGVEDPEADV